MLVFKKRVSKTPPLKKLLRIDATHRSAAGQRRGDNSGGAATNRNTGQRGAADSTRKGSKLAVRQNTSGDMPPLFVRLFGSLIRVEFHLSGQHVGFLAGHRATTNYLHADVAVLVEVQFNLRIRLQLHDPSIAKIDSGTYLIRSFYGRPSQQRRPGTDRISVHGDWLIVFGSQPRGYLALRHRRGGRRVRQSTVHIDLCKTKRKKNRGGSKCFPLPEALHNFLPRNRLRKLYGNFS